MPQGYHTVDLIQFFHFFLHIRHISTLVICTFLCSFWFIIQFIYGASLEQQFHILSILILSELVVKLQIFTFVQRAEWVPSSIIAQRAGGVFHDEWCINLASNSSVQLCDSYPRRTVAALQRMTLLFIRSFIFIYF